MIRFIFLAVVLLDQFSKSLVLRRMSFNQSIPVVPSVFHITLVGNTGIAFGLFKGNSALLVFVGLLTLFWIYGFIRRRRIKDRTLLIGLGLVSGGAFGNLMDRIHYGYVIDFLDFRIWPVFNIADLCISIGTALFFVACFKK